MFQNSITCIESFDPDSPATNVGARWSKWLKRFERFALASGITDDNRLCALILHVGGEKLSDLADNLDINPRPAAGEQQAETMFGATKRVLTAHFTNKRNPEYGEYVFRKAKQESGETVEQYSTRLLQLADECDFQDKRQAVKRQIIHGCRSTSLRKEALRHPEWDLSKLLEIARTAEVVKLQVEEMEDRNATAEVSFVRRGCKTGK